MARKGRPADHGRQWMRRTPRHFAINTTSTITASFLATSITDRHPLRRVTRSSAASDVVLSTTRSTHPLGQVAYITADLRSSPPGGPTRPHGHVPRQRHRILDVDAVGRGRVNTSNTSIFPVGPHTSRSNIQATRITSRRCQHPEHPDHEAQTDHRAVSLRHHRDHQDNVTLTATAGSYLGVTGIITFTVRHTLGTAPLVNHRPRSPKASVGLGRLRRRVRRDRRLSRIDGSVTNVTSHYGAMPAAPSVWARKATTRTCHGETSRRSRRHRVRSLSQRRRIPDDAAHHVVQPCIRRTTRCPRRKGRRLRRPARNASDRPLHCPLDLITLVTFTDDPIVEATSL